MCSEMPHSQSWGTNLSNFDEGVSQLEPQLVPQLCSSWGQVEAQVEAELGHQVVTLKHPIDNLSYFTPFLDISTWNCVDFWMINSKINCCKFRLWICKGDSCILFHIFHLSSQSKTSEKHFDFFTSIYSAKCSKKQPIFFPIFCGENCEKKWDEKCVKKTKSRFKFSTLFHRHKITHFTVLCSPKMW